MSDQLIKPTPASTAGELTQAQVAAWREQGFAFVSGLLPATLVDALRAAAVERFPAPDKPEAAGITDFGSAGAFTFPSQTDVFNAITLHPNLLRAVAALLGIPVEELRLSQSDLWPKYGRPATAGNKKNSNNSDQRIHVDYPNHNLAHPTPWDKPEAVEMIVYLDDQATTGGGTAVVAREGPDDPAYRWPIVDSPGIGDLRYVNDRDGAERYFAEMRPALAKWRQGLYAREKVVRFRPGDILLYRHDTWHRGTPVNRGALRLAHNLTYRKASSEWISTLHVGWAWSAYKDNKFMERLIATCSLAQRAVLGFPQPGADYWCDATIDAVTARYGMFGFDPAPYRDALR